MSFLKFTTFSLVTWAALNSALAQNPAVDAEAAAPSVEWYAPEIDASPIPEHAKVIISGKTLPGVTVRIDSASITKLNEGPGPESEGRPQERVFLSNCPGYERPNTKSKLVFNFRKDTKVNALVVAPGWVKVLGTKKFAYASQSCFVPLKAGSGVFPPDTITVRANAEGFFEIGLDLTPGLAQIPVTVVAPNKSAKTFLLTADVSLKKNDIKVNTEISKNKPPAASKNIRIWVGSGMTYQSNQQTTAGAPDLAFKTFQAPGLMARGGYWGQQWGLDLYFRDAPGKIKADPPFQIQSDTYHWQTMEAKGLYQFPRGPASRIFGLPSQWQLRFGAQLHQIPFLDVDTSSFVTIQDHSVTMATLGVGLLLGEENAWSYEFAFSPQFPVGAQGVGGPFTISSTVAYEFQAGAAYKIAPNWRIGLFSYTQSLQYAYNYEKTAGTIKTGTQNLFYTTFDLRLGFEY